MPAGTLLLTRAEGLFLAPSVAWALTSGPGAGVRGSLNGCADAGVVVVVEYGCEERGERGKDVERVADVFARVERKRWGRICVEGGRRA